MTAGRGEADLVNRMVLVRRPGAALIGRFHEVIGTAAES